MTAEESTKAEASPAATAATGGRAAGGADVARPWWLRLLGHDGLAPLLLLGLTLLLFIPGQMTVPPLDRDEPRFTQASKQMLERNDFVDIRYQDEARHKKPVGIYWLQVAAVKLTGHDATAPLWVYRLPSLIAAVLAVQMAYWFARAFTGPPAALIAGLFVAGAVIVGVEARLAKTDAALFAAILLAQGALARLWLAGEGRRTNGLAFLFWTGLGLGVLIKGPVAPMVVGLTVLALMAVERKAAWFARSRPLPGVIWLVLLVLPWFVAITLATDGAFFREAIGKDLLGKVGQGQEGHGAPPFTHLAVMFAIFWPLPAYALLSLSTIWRERASPLVRFCAAWFVPSWIVFELVATKLPHYTMPLLPALALPVAVALVAGAGALASGEVRGSRRLSWVAAVLLALPPVGLAVVALAGPLVLGVWPSPPGVVLVVIAACLALVGAGQILKGAPLKALPASIGAALFVAFGFWGYVGPALSPIWVSPRLVAEIARVTPCADPQVASTGFNEPSFVFLQGTDTLLVGPEANADFLAGDVAGSRACRISVVDATQEDRFLAQAPTKGLVPVLLGRVQGLNINGGDELDLALYGASASTVEKSEDRAGAVGAASGSGKASGADAPLAPDAAPAN